MNGNRAVIVVIIVLAVLAFGYIIYSNRTSNPTPSPAPAETTVQPSSSSSVTEGSGSGVTAKEVGVSLNTQSNSGESGTATLKEVDGKTVVSIKLAGAPKGSLQPAHIHTGSCPDPGAIKFPLTNVVDGNSETTLDVSMKDLMAMQPLSINVHKSAAEIKTYVACGNLTP